jgi:hypothetical protein
VQFSSASQRNLDVTHTPVHFVDDEDGAKFYMSVFRLLRKE